MNILKDTKLTTLKSHKIKSPNIIFAACIFKTKNQYRNFDKYVNYLFNTVNQFKKIRLQPSNKILANSIFRIYMDRNVTKKPCSELLKTVIKIINEEDFVDLVSYENSVMQNYEEEGVKYHDGTFGTFIRMFPFFNDEKWDAAFMIDIDMNTASIEEYPSMVSKFMAEKSYGTSSIYICYNKSWVPKTVKYPLIGHFCGFKVKLPISLINDFFKYNLYTVSSYIISHKNIKYIKDHHINVMDNLPYGCDEYFLNNYVISYLHGMNYKSYLFINNILKVFIKKIIFNLNKKLEGYLGNIFSELSSKFEEFKIRESDVKKCLGYILELENILYLKKNLKKNKRN